MGVHDSGYKQLFAFPAMVEDLLRGFVKETWVDDLDFSTLERKNGSYVSDDLREREDDIIWRVKWQGADRWMYVYLLIEFQTKHEIYMGLRLVNYVSLLYQDIIRTGGLPSGEKLPPVLPMVVYRGDVSWNAPLDLKDLIESPPGSLAAYTPSMRYLLLEEAILDPKALEAMSNLVAEMFRIEKSPTMTDSVAALISFFKWTQKAGPQQDSLKRALMVWFKRAQKAAKIIDKDDAVETMAIEEMEPMLSERIEKWQQELIDQGEAKGLAEGEARGEAALLIRLCIQKFGSIPNDVREEICSLDSQRLLALGDRLLTAASIEDLLAP